MSKCVAAACLPVLLLAGCASRFPVAAPARISDANVNCTEFQRISRLRIWRVSVDNTGFPKKDWARQHLEGFCGTGLRILPWGQSEILIALFQLRRGPSGTTIATGLELAPTALEVAGTALKNRPISWVSLGVGFFAEVKAALDQRQELQLLQIVQHLCGDSLAIPADGGAECFFLELIQR